MQTEAQNRLGKLGGVDKFKPVSGSGEMDHAEEAIGQLVVAGGDGAVDLEVTEHALDAVALLIDRPGMTAWIFRSTRSARMASAS